MKYIKQALVRTSALAGASAAWLWRKASVVEVQHQSQPDADGWESSAILDTDGPKAIDFIATAKRQTYWNKGLPWLRA